MKKLATADSGRHQSARGTKHKVQGHHGSYVLVVVLLTAFLRGGGEIGAPASLRFLGGLFVAIVRLQRTQEKAILGFVC